ncbi:MAG: hypothetical protein CMH04_04240 [Marinovum sp.]|nr:hypothetical protein [Marinovum sp.]
MATIIKIKNSGTSGAPSAVATGEFAYSFQNGSQANGGDRLYIGTGTETAGAAANIEVIGGKYFTAMLDHVHGTNTASSAVILDSNQKIDVWNVDNLTMNGNSLTSTDTNGDITIDPNGTGNINLTGPVVQTAGNVQMTTATGGSIALSATATGTISLIGAVSINGALAQTGNSSVTGQLDVDNLRLDGNTMSSTDTNGNINIAPNGTGETVVSSTTSIKIPVGTTAQRPSNSTGQIRFNTTDGRFEGYDGNAWAGLGGVVDVDQDTFIRAETAPTNDNDDLEFFTGGTKRATMSTTGMIFDDATMTFQAGKIKIDDDTISSTSGGVITIDPNPVGAAGSVVIEGNLTVNGTQTTVNSTTVTIDDPVFTLAGDTAPGTNDGLDKGIEFRWYDTQARLGFFGYDLSDNRFKMIEDATLGSGVYSGTVSGVQFGNAKLTSITMDGTGTGYAQNGVLVTDSNDDVVYKTSGTDGHVLQVNASGVPFFGHIDCGTY